MSEYERMRDLFNYNLEICVAFVRICHVQDNMIIIIILNNKNKKYATNVG